jgi:hypothetical protein
MPTFSELHEKLLAAKNRRLVLLHIADLIEGEFLSHNPESRPKRLLLNEDKVPVPQTAFDEVVESILKEVQELDKHIQQILQSTLQDHKVDGTQDAQKEENHE